jgi:hypothetical protein
MAYRSEASDFLKSSCRDYEQDADNFEDTDRLAHIIMSKFTMSYGDAFDTAASFTGYEGEN